MSLKQSNVLYFAPNYFFNKFSTPCDIKRTYFNLIKLLEFDKVSCRNNIHLMRQQCYVQVDHIVEFTLLNYSIIENKYQALYLSDFFYNIFENLFNQKLFTNPYNIYLE